MDVDPRQQRGGITFLGQIFQPVRLADKVMLQDYLRRYPQRVSGYTFASLAAWSQPYGIMWSRLGPECVLLSRIVPEANGERHLLQPIGVPTEACCAEMMTEAARLTYRLKMLYVASAYMEQNANLCAQFDAEEDRSAANYIYLARDLAELTGRNFAKKRNLIAQFLTLHPTWEAVALDGRCGPMCRDVLLAIAHGDDVAANEPSLRAELEAVDFAMMHFDELEQSGLVIKVDGQPVAFSIFERQNIDTAAVHFEKALKSIKGLYQMVNRETARRIATAGYHLINREEDLDRPGLRQAKLSYFPLDIYPVFNLSFTGVISTT